MSFINNKNTIFLIITYNPDSNIFNIIKEIKKLKYHFIIVDNSIDEDEIIKKIMNDNSDDYFLFNKNINGISRALNIGFVKAIKNNYEFVITLDQDSLFDSNLINNFNILFNKYKSSIGAIGVNHSISENSILKYKESFELINSGTIVNCKAFKKVNGYDEFFFIDNVDFDFFLRINGGMYKTFKLLNYGIQHKLGTPIMLNYLFFKISFAKYSASRLYHFSFSNIYFIKKYIRKKPFFCIKKMTFFIIYLFHSLFIYNNNEIKSIYLGLKNAFKTKLNG